MSLLRKSVLLGLAATSLAQSQRGPVDPELPVSVEPEVPALRAIREPEVPASDLQPELPSLRTYVTAFGDAGVNETMPVWEMEFVAHDDDEAQVIAEENSIEALMMKDDLGQMLLQLEQVLEQRMTSLARRGGEMSEGDLESLNQLRRFKNLKAMVMSLQPAAVTVFGRYCYYGCWCLPQGQHNLASGYGQPIDPVDAVCKEFALCYKCIDIDFGGSCNPEKRGYKWGKSYDDVGNQVDVRCKNNHNDGPSHRCARFVCECDRILAVGLSHVWMYWNQTFHARWSTLNPGDPGYFAKEDDCITVTGDYRQDACCGAYGAATHDVHQQAGNPGAFPIKPYSRRPYASTNPNNGCCQDAAIFDTTNQECCILPDDTHAIHHDKHYPNGTLIDDATFGVMNGQNRWFGASGPDNDAVGDLDVAPDVQVTPKDTCEQQMSGTVVPADGVADWGTNYYQKK